MLAKASRTPLELFAKLKYEGHPLLLWVITQFTDNPMAMQVLHLAIELGMLVWRVSPFRPIEKLLLILSYYLFWEYFVVSGNYALAVLLGFGFIALRIARPDRRGSAFMLLGLLANTTVFGTIWSLGLAAFFTLRERQERRAMLAGGAVYAVLVAIADVVTSVARAMQGEGEDEAILIMSFPAGLAKQTSDPSLVLHAAQDVPRGVRRRRGVQDVPGAQEASSLSTRYILR